MSKKNEEWKIAAQKILNVKNIILLKKVRHHGTGNIVVFSAGGKKYLIKRYADDRYGAREASNLLNVQNSGIHTPKYFGYHKGFFVEGYIEGKLFQDIINAGKPHTEIYIEAVCELSKIHSCESALKDKRMLKKNFEMKPLKKRLELFFCSIRKIGLPSLRKLSMPIKKDWMRALQKISVSKLIEVNGVHGNSYVIGHGDYKPNNIIIGKQGLYVVDWLSMAKAQPWYDLSYLLVQLKSIKEKEKFILQYLDETNSSLSLSRAMGLFRYGMIYQELQRAKSNSHRIRSVEDTHHINEFKRAMDGVASVVL